MKVRTFVSRDYFSCNTYIVSKDNINFIVDPGCYNKKIKEYISSLGGLSFILCTHGHFDHIGSLDEILSDFPDAKVYAFRDEIEVIMNPNKSLTSQCPDRGSDFHSYIPKCDINALDEGLNRIQNIEFEVIHTPGHTKGSAIFLFKEDHICFMGDTIICESIGRTDLPTSSQEELFSSLKKIVSLNISRETECYFGHGYMLKYEKLLEKNIFLNKCK